MYINNLSNPKYNSCNPGFILYDIGSIHFEGPYDMHKINDITSPGLVRPRPFMTIVRPTRTRIILLWSTPNAA